MKSTNVLKENFNTIKYAFKLVINAKKDYIPIVFFSALFNAAMPFFNIIMPKYIIDELLTQKRIEHLVFYVAITVVGNFLLSAIGKFFDKSINVKNEELNFAIDLYFNKMIMKMKFENIENPEILDLKERALFPLKNQGIIWQLVDTIINTFTLLFTVLGLVLIISTLNVFIILAILVIVVMNGLIFKKSQEVELKTNQEMMPVNRKFSIFLPLAFDFTTAKDIRLFNMKNFILKKQSGYVNETIGLFKKLFYSSGKYSGLTSINTQVQMILVYAYVSWKAVQGVIGIGDFAMYTNAANTFSSTLSQFISYIMKMGQICAYLRPLKEFEQIAVQQPISGTKSVNCIQTIEFKDVSFQYPSASEYALKNVSITVAKGEKLSIVGMNGAGKTTFIKLLTRLYEPTSGEILLNGFPLKEYDFSDYIHNLAVVFQDFKLFAFTIEENIALNEAGLTEKNLKDIIKKAGLEEKINSLAKGAKTSVFKIFEEDGIEFSGGESQKLAIARAIYKNSQIVILDEPTSALDPIAEYEIYKKFDELLQITDQADVKTAIYISHRMSSCRFCDKIAVFHEGELVQQGTHNELLSQSGSQYEKMWNLQSQYYKE